MHVEINPAGSKPPRGLSSSSSSSSTCHWVDKPLTAVPLLCPPTPVYQKVAPSSASSLYPPDRQTANAPMALPALQVDTEGAAGGRRRERGRGKQSALLRGAQGKEGRGVTAPGGHGWLLSGCCCGLLLLLLLPQDHMCIHMLAVCCLVEGLRVPGDRSITHSSLHVRRKGCKTGSLLNTHDMRGAPMVNNIQHIKRQYDKT